MRSRREVVKEAGERGGLCVTCAFHFPARELGSPPSAAVTSRFGMMQSNYGSNSVYSVYGFPHKIKSR
jgi:hypothetical protein